MKGADIFINSLQERQFLVASILIEFLVSSTFYILRFWYLEEFNPSTLFLALFVRSQLTNTITLGLIFLPKLWYQHKQVNWKSQPKTTELLPAPVLNQFQPHPTPKSVPDNPVPTCARVNTCIIKSLKQDQSTTNEKPSHHTTNKHPLNHPKPHSKPLPTHKHTYALSHTQIVANRQPKPREQTSAKAAAHAACACVHSSYVGSSR